MTQRSLLLRIFAIRELRLLLQFPVEEELLEPVLRPLIACAQDPERAIGKEAVRTILSVFWHLEVEQFASMGTNFIPHLLKYFDDDEVRQASIALFGMLRTGVKEHRRNAVTEDILRSLVPLLIQLADPGSHELWRHQSKLSGMLAQMADSLRNNVPSYRQAAALLIALNTRLHGDRPLPTWPKGKSPLWVGHYQHGEY